MSPAYGRDTAWIGVIAYKPYDKPVEYQNFFDHFQRIMIELGRKTNSIQISFPQQNIPPILTFSSEITLFTSKSNFLLGSLNLLPTP